ncbi:polysaccharide deacetylase family protein [Colwellia sp. E2M01]|uniref:polysaccharide deacetylase family protein n=1 Tax=Colwellia sp. E2M01 TaxID=2841561 RepID=UPI001C0837CD|nr:polysaccharide deacetylase family protein [Colwellia sp. E2M01]MBU2869530.1 polysaccharide deacetylase family protein [Colwellia sp. E2M01]
MRYLLQTFIFASLLMSISLNSYAAVILQYHHVSDSSPSSTSISPKQFEVHLQYLKDNGFKVVPLSNLIDGIKKQTPLADKSVAITFDDAYIDILTQAKPILDKFNFPYTIYVNPGIINRNDKKSSSQYLSWDQLKALADEGVIIANHGYEHHSMARTPKGLTQQEWLDKQTTSLLKAEQLIKEQTGQSWRYFAYPYGEYDLAVQAWIEANNFVAFSQQSGAIGLNTDLTSVPRFPASQPYDKISGLRDKLNSLPLDISLTGEQAKTVFVYEEAKNITFEVASDDFYKSGLNCYISGLGKQKINWHDDEAFSITFSTSLPVGRVRANCTAASISKPGRYYWYSKPWFVLNADGSWYHL